MGLLTARNLLCILFALSLSVSFGQGNEGSETPDWEFNATSNFYFIPDDFFIVPVISADKNKLHLEARYNYEDRETFSGWAGYNFSGGEQLEYLITPMIGGVFGRTDGIAPGLKVTLTYKRFELYTESEYVIDPAASENNYFYNWSELTYSPNEKFWFGISGQRTRLYQTDLEIQRGLFGGFAIKNWTLATYLYNIGFDDPFIIVSLSVDF